MVYLTEVVSTCLVQSMGLFLFIEVRVGCSLLLLTKPYSLPHLSLAFTSFKGLRWKVDSFSAVKKLVSCFPVLWSIRWWMTRD